jgi:regulator of replication initiation timing
MQSDKPNPDELKRKRKGEGEDDFGSGSGSGSVDDDENFDSSTQQSSSPRSTKARTPTALYTVNITSSKTDLAKCKDENEKSQAIKDESFQTLQALLGELEALTTQLTEMTAAGNSNDTPAKMAEIEAKQAEVDAALKEYCYTVENCDEELENCKKEIERLNAQIEGLRTDNQDLNAENEELKEGLADKLFSDPDFQEEGEVAAEESMGDVGEGAGAFIQAFSPVKQVDSGLNAYASGYAREMGKYSEMANEIVARAVQENAEYVIDVATMKKFEDEYKTGRFKTDETIPSVSYTVANPTKPFTQYQIDNLRLLEIFAENNCFTCWRDIRAEINEKEMPWTVGISGALTIADLLIRSLDYTYMILTSTPFMGVFTDVIKYPSINQFITQKNKLYKIAFATAQSRTTLESVEVLTLTTLIVLSLSELIYATYYNPTDCIENVAAQTAVEKEIEVDEKAKDSKGKKQAAAKIEAPTGKGAKGAKGAVPAVPAVSAASAAKPPAAKASGGVAAPLAGDPQGDEFGMKPLIFATVNLMCKFLSTKSLLDVGISAVLYKFMKCSLNKGFAFFTSDGSAASDASIRGVPTYSQITFYVGETTTLSGNKVDSYNCKRVFCIDDPAIAGYLWIVKNVMTKYEAFKQTNPATSIKQFLETQGLLGDEESFIFKEIYFMGDPDKQNPQLYSTIYDDATSLASDGEMSAAFTAMLGKEMAVGGMVIVEGGQTSTIYERLKYIGYNEIGYGFDADLYKCSTLSRLMFNKKFGHMTEREFQEYITLTTLDYMRHDYEGKGGGANPSSVRYLLLGLNLMRKMRRFKLDNNSSIPPPPPSANAMVQGAAPVVEPVVAPVVEDDDYKADYSWVTRISAELVTALMRELQAELTDYDRSEIVSMNNKDQFEKYLKIYKDAITPAGIFYWSLHPCLIPGAKIKDVDGVLKDVNETNNARTKLFNTYLYMAAKSVGDYEGDLFRGELHMYGITSKGTPRVWLAGINKLAVKKTHDAVLNNVQFIARLAARNILLGNTAISLLLNGVVDLQLSLSSINTQAKSVIGIDATNSADGNSGTTEDPRSTTVVEYLQPTSGFVNGLQICTIYSGSNSTGIVYSPEDTSDIEFLNGAILYGIRPENFVIIEKTAPAVIKQLSEFSKSPAVEEEIAKITLTPQPLPQTEELTAALDAVNKVKELVPKSTSSLATPFKFTPLPSSSSSSSSSSSASPFIFTPSSSASSSFSSSLSSSSSTPSKVKKDIFRQGNQVSRKAQSRRGFTSSSSSPSLSSSAPVALTGAVVSVLGDINIVSVNETSIPAKPATTEEAATTAATTAAVAIFKGEVETRLQIFSAEFKKYIDDYNAPAVRGKPKEHWPKKAVKENFIEVIQTNLRPLVVNINTAYNTMLSSIANMAFSIVAVMSINAAVNTIFGILYTTLASQVQVFQTEQDVLMKEPDVEIRVSSRKGAVTKGAPVANPIAYRPFGLDIPIFPVDAAIMVGGGVNNDLHTKSKSKNKDTRSFKVKSDKKTSRKKK